MSLRIYIGGVLEVPGDNVGLALASVGASGQIALKCDAGQRTAEQVTVNAPEGCEVSKDNMTYGATAVYAAGTIADTMVACYVRRSQSFVASKTTTGGTTVPRVALVATEATGVDVTSPTLSGTLVATAGYLQATLSGVSATDNVGVTKGRYRVDGGSWVDFAWTGGLMTPVVVNNLAAVAHDFEVVAVDAAGNVSTVKSASATPTQTDTTAPVLSGGYIVQTVSGNSSQLRLFATDLIATDNVGVTGYDVEYGTTVAYGASLTAAVVDNTFITGLTAGTLYHVRVRAYDAAGNKSNWVLASGTTAASADTTAPVLTGSLSPAAGNGQVVLDWPDATDNVGVTGYDVEYGTTVAYGSTIAPPTTSTATITGLAAGTLYYFRVRARDAAGNVSGWLTTSAVPTAEVVPATYDFAGTAGSAPPAAITVQTAGNGTAALDGSGNLKLYSAATADGATAGLTTPIKKEARTYKRKFRLTASLETGYVDILQVSGRATRPPIGPGADSLAFNDFFIGLNTTASVDAQAMISYRDSAGTQYWWSGSAWVTAAAGVSTTKLNTDYVAILETTATQARLTLKDGTETTTILQSPLLDWSAIRNNTSNLWLWWGDVSSTSRYATTLDDSFTVA